MIELPLPTNSKNKSCGFQTLYVPAAGRCSIERISSTIMNSEGSVRAAALSYPKQWMVS